MSAINNPAKHVLKILYSVVRPKSDELTEQQEGRKNIQQMLKP